MTLLLPPVAPSNIAETLAASTTSGVGGTITISAPALIRKSSGVFALAATASVTTPGSGTQGVIAQLLSTASIAPGPQVTVYGASALAQVKWTDFSPLLPGQPVQYSLKIRPVSSSNSIAVAAGAASVVAYELPGQLTDNPAGMAPPINGLVLWLDPDRGVSLSGSNVTSWADLTGSQLPFTQGSNAATAVFTAADPNLNGLATVRVTTAPGAGFAGLQSDNAFIVPPPFTVAITCSFTTINPNQVIVYGGGLNDLSAGQPGLFELRTGNNTNSTSVFADVTTPRIYLCEGAINGGTSALYFNSGSVTKSTYPQTVSSSFGGPVVLFNETVQNQSIASIRQILMYNRILSTAERIQLVAFLGADAGIAVT